MFNIFSFIKRNIVYNIYIYQVVAEEAQDAQKEKVRIGIFLLQLSTRHR